MEFSRCNTTVETTLALPMRSAHVAHAKCPSGMTSACSGPLAYPPWFIELQKQSQEFRTEVAKCHPH